MEIKGKEAECIYIYKEGKDNTYGKEGRVRRWKRAEGKEKLLYVRKEGRRRYKMEGRQNN